MWSTLRATATGDDFCRPTGELPEAIHLQMAATKTVALLVNLPLGKFTSRLVRSIVLVNCLAIHLTIGIAGDGHFCGHLSGESQGDSPLGWQWPTSLAICRW